MESKKRVIKGKIGGPVEHVQYTIEKDSYNSDWLYLTYRFEELKTPLLIGLIIVENNRGIKVKNYSLTGKAVLFHLDRQFFEMKL